VKKNDSSSFADLTKVTLQSLQDLASEEDVADVLNLYADFSTSPGPEDSVGLQDQRPAVTFHFGDAVNGADPGVEVESSLSPEVLATNLGFPELPLLFNSYRHRGGLTAWDPQHVDLFEPKNATIIRSAGLMRLSVTISSRIPHLLPNFAMVFSSLTR
jgi:hypothetical protein